MEGHKSKLYRVGIDCGSKTVKIVAVDDEGALAYKSYLRHRTNIKETLASSLAALREKIGDVSCRFTFTGSAGMQIADELGIPFVQEVVASKMAVRTLVPDADVVIELGGEDSKILFLTGGEELRMNSTCAGGTGGFIDTIAGMLDTNAAGLALQAKKATTVYPIASRCAVFAQSDVRPLLNEGASRADIAASTFQAVVNQCVAGLACGREIRGKVVMLGGPLHFLEPLAQAFRDTLGLDDQTGVVPPNAHLFVAFGSAIVAFKSQAMTVSALERRIGRTTDNSDGLLDRLDPLFSGDADYQAFRREHERFHLPSARMWHAPGPFFLGIDSGSTTMKAALTDDQGRLLWSYYNSNEGDVITSARRMLRDLYQSMIGGGHTAVATGAYIAKAAVTGYGEDLLKQAFHLDGGLVETVAHLKAATSVMPRVDTVLDIGGQDIKCIRAHDGHVDDIALNEACSSGCGALLGGFAHSMQMSDYLFTQAAVKAQHPVDLGTRCTVFMTSRVRHAQKVGASKGDISAGLAYSVVRNALYKVMKVRDVSELGENIVVQGGTFKNDAVLRALEKLLGRTVARTDYPELMGAYGAALYARELDDGKPSTILNAFRASTIRVDRTPKRCELCPNACQLVQTTISHSTDEAREYNPMIFVQKGIHSMGADDTDKYRAVSAQFIMGNRCSRPLGDVGADHVGLDLVDKQYRRLFRIDDPVPASAAKATVGIPRALGMYEQFPYWQAFFSALGVRVVLSAPGSRRVYMKGMETIPSESTCYPAKMAHGYIADLVEKGVDTIFLPRAGAQCTGEGRCTLSAGQECPVAADYAKVLQGNIAALEASGVTTLSPQMTLPGFEGVPNAGQLAETVRTLAPQASAENLRTAMAAGEAALDRYHADLTGMAEEALRFTRHRGARGAVLSCKPYHVDPEAHHGIPKLLASYGMAVMSSDMVFALMVRQLERGVNAKERALLEDGPAAAGAGAETGWRTCNRQAAALRWTVDNPAFETIALYSFGCGVDATMLDGLRQDCEGAGKVFTALKIDEMIDMASTRIRVRSLLAALDEQKPQVAEETEGADGGETNLSNARVNEPTAASPDTDHPILEDATASQPARESVTDGRANDPAPRRFFMPSWMPHHLPHIVRVLTVHGYDIAIGPDESGAPQGLAIANNDACHLVLSALGQLETYRTHGGDADRALLLPYACPGCCSSCTGHVARRVVDGFEDGTTLTLLDLIASDPSLIDELARAVVDGDCEQMTSAHLLGSEAGSAEGRIAILGTAPLTLTPTLNNNLIDVVSNEHCEALPPSFATQLIHAALVRVRASGKPSDSGRRAERDAAPTRDAASSPKRDAAPALDTAALTALRDFAENCAHVQEVAYAQLASQGVGYAPALSWSRVCRVAEEQGLDCTVDAGMGWCAEATMMSLLDAGVNSILLAQTFACLSGHVSGQGVFRHVRQRFSNANLSVVEYDAGISQVNQINRIKLLAALAKPSL